MKELGDLFLMVVEVEPCGFVTPSKSLGTHTWLLGEHSWKKILLEEEQGMSCLNVVVSCLDIGNGWFLVLVVEY